MPTLTQYIREGFVTRREKIKTLWAGKWAGLRNPRYRSEVITHSRGPQRWSWSHMTLVGFHCSSAFNQLKQLIAQLTPFTRVWTGCRFQGENKKPAELVTLQAHGRIPVIWTEHECFPHHFPNHWNYANLTVSQMSIKSTHSSNTELLSLINASTVVRPV